MRSDIRTVAAARCSRREADSALLVHDIQHVGSTCAQAKKSRARSGFGNKPIAAKRLRSAVIAIFAQHSTPRGSSTIIPPPNDRAVPRGVRQEMAMKHALRPVVVRDAVWKPVQS
jgi:hypothetical protein